MITEADAVINDIDLRTFIANDERPYLRNPSTLGVYTYATNGRVMVRVAKRDHIKPVEGFPNAEKLFANFKPGRVFKIERADMPKPRHEKCEHCNGTGDHKCNCEHCDASCEECEGTGQITFNEARAILPFGRMVMADTLRRVFALPGDDVRLVMHEESETNPVCNIMLYVGVYEVLTMTCHNRDKHETVEVQYTPI